MGSCPACRPGPCCPMGQGRRAFLKRIGAGASALAVRTGLFDVAASLFAAESKPAGGPRVRVVFLRPRSREGYWMGWPGQAFDPQAMQASYVKELTEGAVQLGVRLELSPEPLEDAAAVSSFLSQLQPSPPDGIIANLMHMDWWEHASNLLKNKGEIPAILFAPMGMSFAWHIREVRGIPRTFVASTQEVGWLRQALRMFRAMWQLRRTRICMIAGNSSRDYAIPNLGTVVHCIPRQTWPQEFQQAETTEEMRALADYYTREARKIVEPKPEDVLNAAKGYVLARRIMAAESCQAITMDCLGLVAARQIPCPPCVAWSRLLDEGGAAACEGDVIAAVGQLLCALLVRRPGFMQDPVPNTVRNTIMAAHCTCPTKLDGLDQPHEPFSLRSHAESALGCVPQVLWRVGQEITIVKLVGTDSMVVGGGRVVGNVDTPPSGGCRTCVEVTVDGLADARDIQGYHQLLLYGNLCHQFRAYAQLAGIKVSPL